MKKAIAGRCALALCLGAASFSYAADGELRLGAGLDYTRGDYGTGTNTTTLSVPFLARYDTDRWTYKLILPYLRVTAPSNFVPGIGRTDNSGSSKGRRFAGTRTEAGLGDTTASATYNVFYERSTGLDLTGRVKLPTGDAGRGLGTGSTDFGMQVDAYQAYDRLTLFADVGYTFFGHSDYVELHNAVNYGVGVSNKLNDLDTIGVSFDGRQRASFGGSPQRELTLFWNRRADRATRFQSYVLFGLANGSPDFGIGVSATRAF